MTSISTFRSFTDALGFTEISFEEAKSLNKKAAEISQIRTQRLKRTAIVGTIAITIITVTVVAVVTHGFGLLPIIAGGASHGTSIGASVFQGNAHNMGAALSAFLQSNTPIEIINGVLIASSIITVALAIYFIGSELKKTYENQERLEREKQQNFYRSNLAFSFRKPQTFDLELKEIAT